MTNDGWSFVALTEDELAAADEETAIRGFKLEKKSQKVLLTVNLSETASV